LIEVINLNAKRDAESGEYERHFAIRPGSLVLDLGAHAGHFSSLACDKGAFVIAFEPHPENFHWLNERLSGRSAVAINKAAYNFTGIVALYHCDTNSGSHSLIKHDQCSDVMHAVGCIDIGQFLESTGIAPDFIKIDTEGAEYNILQSLLLAGVKTNMAIEVHSSELYERCRFIAEVHEMIWLPETNYVGVCYCFPRVNLT